MMPQKPGDRVLVIGGSTVYQHLLVTYLRDWGFEVTVAANETEGWTLLERPGSPNLVLLDGMMTGTNGLELCRKLRQRQSADCYVYTILLTAKGGHGDLVKAVETGVDDYVVTPFDAPELRARLTVGRRFVDLQRKLSAARELTHHAAHDKLTGLLNRREIEEYLRRELSRSLREQRPLTVMLADIDHFQEVNARMGRIVGDEILKEVAHRLRSSLRVYDGVGRHGGEAFLLVLPGCDLTSAFIRADQIRSSVSTAAIVPAAAPGAITVSMGIAVANGNTPIEPNALLRQAGLGLYRAKSMGRNRVEQIDDELVSGFAPLAQENTAD